MKLGSPTKRLPSRSAPPGSLERPARSAAPPADSPWPRALYRGWLFLLGLVVALCGVELLARCDP